MPHGGPDWDVTAGARTTYRWADLDEHAARLGSIVGFDRRGDVLFLDSFEEGHYKWLIGAIGTGGSVDLSRASPRSGVYSLRLIPGSTSSRTATAQRIWAYPILSAFGLEASFTLHGNLQQVNMAIFVYTGARVWQVYGRYYHTTGELQIYVAGGAWQTIRTIANPLVSSKGYHTWKLVGDPSSGKYVRSIFDAYTDDISAYAMDAPVSAVSPELFTQVQAISIPLNNATVYLDDVIVTQNEPV
jgi:hypothetical protein